MWLIILSDQLTIVALVGSYPTNKLIVRRLLPRQLAPLAHRHYAVLATVSRRYPPPQDRYLRVTHPSATTAETVVRLACVKHAASVRSEPGSNSQVHLNQPSRRTIDQNKQTLNPLSGPNDGGRQNQTNQRIKSTSIKDTHAQRPNQSLGQNLTKPRHQTNHRHKQRSRKRRQRIPSNPDETVNEHLVSEAVSAGPERPSASGGAFYGRGRGMSNR